MQARSFFLVEGSERPDADCRQLALPNMVSSEVEIPPDRNDAAITEAC